jgi:N-acetyl-anhydromuramyl-L-alanine amidase AmpD
MTTTAKYYTPGARDEDDIWLLILHSTSGSGTAEGMRRYFENPDSKVSYHYTIDAAGRQSKSVDPQSIAWHAGNWDVNKRSIGIGLVGAAGQARFPQPQLHALKVLMARLSFDYNLSLKRIYNYADGRTQLPFGVAQHSNVWGADHTDIAPGFPIRDICADARDYRNKMLGVPRTERA